MSPHMTDSRFVYRCFEASGRLLYVGLTNNVANRTATHRRSWWGHHIATIKSVEYPTAAKARQAERLAIHTEAPRFNRQGRWHDRSTWSLGDYRDFYDATRFGASSSHQAPRLARTQEECLRRYGVDLAKPTEAVQ